MQACGLGMALRAASLSLVSELGLGIGGRLSEPDGFSREPDPSNLESVSAGLDPSVESVSLPASGLAFAVSALPTTRLDGGASLSTGCGPRFDFASRASE